MKSIKQIGIVCTCLFFVFGMATYCFQIGTARGEVSYSNHIQPLFTQDGAWFNYGGLASNACGTCHAGDDGIDPEECPPECHLMDLKTCDGVLNG
ncbi:MAG TPA: hypothetical protein VI489_01440, partial [Candidatus Brocadiaceae bacterium]